MFSCKRILAAIKPNTVNNVDIDESDLSLITSLQNYSFRDSSDPLLSHIDNATSIEDCTPDFNLYKGGLRIGPVNEKGLLNSDKFSFFITRFGLTFANIRKLSITKFTNEQVKLRGYDVVQLVRTKFRVRISIYTV